LAVFFVALLAAAVVSWVVLLQVVG